MNIRDWPMDGIMQLPDHCFGRRWPIACEISTITDPTYDISEIALPERCVVWSVALDWWNASIDTDAYIRLALGDQLPLNVGMMNILEALIRGVGVQSGEPRYIGLEVGSLNLLWPMRMGLAAAGRRLVMSARPVGGNWLTVRCVLEVSSMPTEVPDWLILEHLRSR